MITVTVVDLPIDVLDSILSISTGEYPRSRLPLIFTCKSLRQLVTEATARAQINIYY